VAKGKSLTWGDVAMDESLPAYKTRQEMEGLFAKTGVAAAKSARRGALLPRH